MNTSVSAKSSHCLHVGTRSTAIYCQCEAGRQMTSVPVPMPVPVLVPGASAIATASVGQPQADSLSESGLTESPSLNVACGFI
jgi:ABC-type transport system involved in cytochrome c biogenesis permease component